MRSALQYRHTGMLYLLLTLLLFNSCVGFSHNMNKSEGYKTPSIEQIIIPLAGRQSSNIVLIDAQGGPAPLLLSDMTKMIYRKYVRINLRKVFLVTVHQTQTLYSKLFQRIPITFEMAKYYDMKTTRMLKDAVVYFKAKGKKVYVIGISFGAFVVEQMLASYGNIADGYVLIVGRLNMPDEVWKAFAEGEFKGFQDGTTVIDLDGAQQAGMGGDGAPEVLVRNMAKLAAGFGYHRYIRLLKDIDLSNVVYVYGKQDEQVGALTKQEIDFLTMKNVTILTSKNRHEETAMQYARDALINILGKEKELFLSP